MSEECEHGRAVWTCLQCADNHRPMALWSVVEEARKERDAAIERAENAESTIKETNGQLNRYGEALRALWALLPKELIVQGASVVDQTRKHISELTERAEKAETALRLLEKHYAELQDFSAELEQRAHKNCLAAKADERARFERECGMRFRAAGIGRWGDEAQWMAAFYFGAKEAGNG